MGIHAFASRVSQARDVEALARCLLDESGDLVGAKLRGLYVFSRDRIDIHVRNLPDGAVERYERNGRAFDPVLSGVKCTHAPCQISFDAMYTVSRDPALPDGFREVVDLALAISKTGQYLSAPLVVDGEIAGTINLSRLADEPFSSEQMMTAFAMALHVSTRLAALRALASGVDESWDEVLTPRGREVADLAARGLTTHEIGRALGISANTAKKHIRIVYDRLGISTRAELAGTLTRRSRSGGTTDAT